MGKRISSRNYARMSPKQCLKNYKLLLSNAGVKYQDAVHLAEKESYGTAISLLILSIEETMKTLVLYLDGHGFLFRNIKGVSNIFVNHKLRYPLAMVISIVSSFGRDITRLAEEYSKRPEESKALLDRFKNNRVEVVEALIKYLKQKSDEMKIDVLWFSNVGLLREDGLSKHQQILPRSILIM
jgi:AbiV family abortive infection protein